MGIPCKTAAGHAELVAGERRLSQRHRTLLLLVDGHRGVDEVVQLGLRAGIPPAYLDELIALGLVVLGAPMPPASSFDTAWREPADAAASPASAGSSGPESDFSALDTVGFGQAASDTQMTGLDDDDVGFARARSALLHALLSTAPVSGAVTMLRIRRARNRSQLRALLPEVQARLAKPHHLAQARQLISQVEHLLAN